MNLITLSYNENLDSTKMKLATGWADLDPLTKLDFLNDAIGELNFLLDSSNQEFILDYERNDK